MPDRHPSERSVFLEAVEMTSAAERAAYLEQACGDNAELRAKVDALLQAHDKPQRLLDAPRAPVPGLGLTINQPLIERPGAVIGVYKLLEQIGEGGFGVVFMAEQSEPVRRKVAFKVLKPGMDTRQVVARFEAERQALAIMDHPNIARVFDGGATASGRPYFVMELVKGVPITKYCDEHRLTPRQRLELFIPICQAIQHAHQKGIIHRDLKPSNVLVSRHDSIPVPKVIDFGVAKALGQELTDKTMFTGLVQMIGTPLYMSPEQAGMSDLDIDTRSDIYSLGVLLYELLTGTTPFTRERFQKAAQDEIRRIIREEEPPKPSTRLTDLSRMYWPGPEGEQVEDASRRRNLGAVASQRQIEPRKLRKLVRGELDWIVMRALEKDRSRRYETVNGLSRDIQRYLCGEPVQACPPSAWYRVGKFVKRNRAPVLVAALLSISLIAGVIGTGWGLIRSKEALRAEADQRNRAEKAAANASALNDFLTEDLLGQADPDRNSPERKVTVEELLRRAEQRIDRSPRFDDQPAAAATLHGTIARTYAKLGLFPEAERHFRRALSIRRGVTGPDAPETLAAQEALADFLNLALHRPSESEPLAKETWQARARVLGSDHPDTLDSLDTYATAVILAGRPREAADLGRRCLQARARTLGTEHEQTVISMNNLANQLADLGEMDESLSLLRQVFAIRQKPGSAKSELAASVYNLAITLLNVGNMAEADGLVTEYAEWAAQTLGPETPGAERLSGLAVRIAVDCGRLDEAIEHGRNVLAHRRKLYPVGDFRIGMVLLDLGRAQAMKNEFEAAQRDLDEAYDILRNASVSLPHYWVPLVQCWRAACFTGLGLYTDAEPLLLQAELDLRMATTAPARHYQVAVEQLIALYHKWGRSGPANEWRKKLPTNDIDRRVQL